MFILKNRIQVLAFFCLLVVLALSASAKTWHLGQGQQWKEVSQSAQGKYLTAVSHIKEMVNAGKTEAVHTALEQLKKDFPEIAGPDLDAFIKAEMLYSEGEFTEAIAAYDKFLSGYRNSPFYEVALDREFAIGTAYLVGQKRVFLKVFQISGHSEGVRVMERIAERVGNAPIAVKAQYAIAESYEKRGEFNEAYFKWSQIASRWSEGEIAKEALLGMARCKHAAYKGPNYDSSVLVSAKSYYENISLKYPADSQQHYIGERMKQVEEQRAFKRFSIGRYYQESDHKQSAVFYYQLTIDNWPDSRAAEMARRELEQIKESSQNENPDNTEVKK